MTLIDAFRDPKDRTPMTKRARQGRFDEIKAVLLGNAIKTEEWLRESASAEETPLHALLRYQPPVDLVTLLISRLIATTKNAVPEEVKDVHGNTPLHVAVAYGCDVAIVRVLLNGKGGVMPAVTKDSDERLPLHLACLSEKLSCSRRSPRKQTPDDQDNMLCIVYSLLSAYPMGLAIRDANGDTPMDLCRTFGKDTRIYVALKDCELECVPNQAVACSIDVPTEISGSFHQESDELSSLGANRKSPRPHHRARSRGRDRVPRSIAVVEPQ